MQLAFEQGTVPTIHVTLDALAASTPPPAAAPDVDLSALIASRPAPPPAQMVAGD